ncbi:AAA family ATPase [Mobilitalea sibirica]|uniref:AAA family ATPase n=1 Tax=Mobilitalea sibirica TaxID=1462919 RepID=A0A8J7L228_9FIRM|nr:AAA family ATPase [Mobilitalea sibirica]MBH1939848.1 AAA family ATPase [Mobilitalea sibirica]
MGKIVMPKNSALLNEIESVLQIYYEADGWLSNDIYKERLKAMIGDDQYSSSYTKKAQITSYFGFTEWENINNPQSMRRITGSGKEMYIAIKSEDTGKVQSVLMNALETVKFGRNNFGCPESDSDVEPPALFIRASMDLGYLTYKEFAYLLWKLEDIGGNYTDSLSELRQFRSSGNLTLGEEATKYVDCKPIMILVRWGFLAEDDDTTGGKHIIVAPEVLEKYRSRLCNLKIYNIDMDCDEPLIDDDRENVNYDKVDRTPGGTNILLYGVPGSGKSWTIEHEYCNEDSIVDRLVFHPDYTNSDFVGQILPVVDEDKQVTYEFTPGPFTTILSNAYHNPMSKYILIIEEINRGNAPAIFGEVFQLLDRKVEMQDGDDGFLVGTSEYGITHKYMAEFIYGNPAHKVRIPSNLSIIGTMNTSDQNVFTLDTAFQRRWQMRLIENNFDNVRPSLADAEILDTDVTWKRFCETVNNIIVGNKAKMASAEDKRLGVYFVHENDLTFDSRALPSEGHATLLVEYNSLLGSERLGTITAEQKSRLKEIREAVMHNRLFPEKVIKYLWDDAFKFNPEALFDTDGMDNLEKVIRTFIYSTGHDRFKIFKQTVRDTLYTAQQ